MTVEIWKAIPNRFPYEASNVSGAIRNSATGRILKQRLLGNRGHLGVKVGGGRNAGAKLVHRLILMAFHGLPKEGQIACHKNDNKIDNRLENLYWGTYKSNAQDAIRNGKFTFVKPYKKYDDSLIRKIKFLYNGKRGQQSFLARKYGMSISNVNLIVNKKTRIK